MHALALLLLLASPARAAEASPEPPTVCWERAPSTLRLKVVPKAGSHLAPDLPVRARLDDGGDFAVTWNEPQVPTSGPLKLELPRVAGADSAGWTLAVDGGVCSDDGSLCVPWNLELAISRHGPPGGRQQAERGRPPQPEDPEPASPEPAKPGGPLSWHHSGHDGGDAGALAYAAQARLPVLVDFYATWCPPCDRLRDEFLTDPSREELLRRFVLLKVDADAPASFAIKDRYRVGGYPTVLVLDPDGGVLDRVVGYPGADPMGLRLASLAAAPEAELRARIEGGGPGARSAAVNLARRAVASEDPAAAWLLVQPLLDEPDRELLELAAAAAPTAEERVRHRLAAAERSPPGHAAGLVNAAMGESPDAEALKAAWSARLLPRLAGARVEVQEDDRLVGVIEGGDAARHDDLATLAWYLAKWAGQDDGVLIPGALHQAAAALSTGQTEPWSLDLAMLRDPAVLTAHEGRVHDLLDLLEAAGAWGIAAPFYPAMLALQPEGFTWHFRHAGHLRKRGQLADAALAAGQAVLHGYGDQRLRAVERYAELLLELDRGDEALAAVDGALAEAAPAEEHVRTHRYRARLEALRGRALELAGPR